MSVRPSAVPGSGNAMKRDYKGEDDGRGPVLMVRAVQSGKTDPEHPLTYFQGEECWKAQGVGGLNKRKTRPYLKTSLSNCHSFKLRPEQRFPGSEPSGELRAPWCHMKCLWTLVWFSDCTYSTRPTSYVVQGTGTMMKFKTLTCLFYRQTGMSSK